MTRSPVQAARLVVAALGLLFALCTSASAQGGPVTRGGALANGDRTLSSGEFADSFSVRVRAGQWLKIDLRSTAFDPYLILHPPTGSQSDNDDAVPGDTQHSQIVFRADETGQFEILATSFAPGETGAYTLVYEVTDSEPGRSASVPSTPASVGSPDVSSWPIGLQSFGPIRYGMTVAEAEAAAGVRISVSESQAGDGGCGFATIVGGPDFVEFMVRQDRGWRVMSVTISGWDQSGTAVTASNRPSTVSGIRIGSTLAEVRRAYPGRITSANHWDSGLPELTYTPRDQTDRDLVVFFNTDGQVVTGISAGFDQWANAFEGCA